MTKSLRVTPKHPLVGSWETKEGYSSAIFTISVKNGKFVVTGVDERDGEVFEISGVSWDGKLLQFTSLMPSTRYRTRHVFHMPKARRLTDELTLYETRKKRLQRKPKRK